jgi:hypothetical protein
VSNPHPWAPVAISRAGDEKEPTKRDTGERRIEREYFLVENEKVIWYSI